MAWVAYHDAARTGEPAQLGVVRYRDPNYATFASQVRFEFKHVVTVLAATQEAGDTRRLASLNGRDFSLVGFP
jgi:hypothetical protein